MKINSPFKAASIMLLACAASACVSGPSVSPVEITRFYQAASTAQLGVGTIFVETAPGAEGDPQDLAPFKAAIAAELVKLGYRETSRENASQIAQVRVERFANEPVQRRGPVSVGLGGGTGSYGSGVGLGVGINLGGKPRDMIGTDLGVMIRDKQSSAVIWEGRATVSVSDNSEFADNGANAAIIADALFDEFPGNNGETVEVRVAK